MKKNEKKLKNLWKNLWKNLLEKSLKKSLLFKFFSNPLKKIFKWVLFIFHTLRSPFFSLSKLKTKKTFENLRISWRVLQ